MVQHIFTSISLLMENHNSDLDAHAWHHNMYLVFIYSKAMSCFVPRTLFVLFSPLLLPNLFLLMPLQLSYTLLNVCTSVRCYHCQYAKHHSFILLIYFQQDATLHSLFICGKLLCVFWVVSPPIIRSTHNSIYSIWYLSNRYCYLLLLWKSWSWFECGVRNVLQQ